MVETIDATKKVIAGNTTGKAGYYVRGARGKRVRVNKEDYIVTTRSGFNLDDAYVNPIKRRGKTSGVLKRVWSL